MSRASLRVQIIQFYGADVQMAYLCLPWLVLIRILCPPSILMSNLLILQSRGSICAPKLNYFVFYSASIVKASSLFEDNLPESNRKCQL